MPSAQRFFAALVLFACLLVGGCGEGSSGSSARTTSDSPALLPVDSITLVESDSSYIATPGELAIAPDGTFYVTDVFEKRLHAFSRHGRFLRAIGRGGRGPGEFGHPGALALDGDSLLYVADQSEIEIFDPRTSTHLGSYAIPRATLSLAVSSGRLFAGSPDAERYGSVARVSADASRQRVTGPFPELLRNPTLFPMFWLTALTMKGDTAATAFVVTNYVYLSDVGGTALDSIWVPARRRHGAQPDVLRRFAENVNDQKLGEAAVYGSSLPMGLHWLPDGMIALVSADWKPFEDRFVESSYLSVIDPRTRRSCVDAPIPGPTDPPVRATVRGDTLFVLSQEVDGDTRATANIRAYRIDTSACRWVTR